jgi:phosphocarrier protein HPr
MEVFVQRIVRVGPEVGLHARPAAAFVAAATALPGPVRIGRDGTGLVDGKSILSVLTLGAQHGEKLVLEADDETALAALVPLIEVGAVSRS